MTVVSFYCRQISREQHELDSQESQDMENGWVFVLTDSDLPAMHGFPVGLQLPVQILL